MLKLNICTLNPKQDEMVAAFVALMDACDKKHYADCKRHALRFDLKAFDDYHPEWKKAFDNRELKRKEAYALVIENPEIAANLIERLFIQISEEG